MHHLSCVFRRWTRHPVCNDATLLSAIAPGAGTRMTADLFTAERWNALKAEFIVPADCGHMRLTETVIRSSARRIPP